MPQSRLTSGKNSIDFEDFDVSLAEDISINEVLQTSGIKSPVRTTKGKYKWSPSTGWRREEPENNSPVVPTEGRCKSRSSHHKTRSQSFFNICKQTSSNHKTPRYRSDSSESEEKERRRTRTPIIQVTVT